MANQKFYICRVCGNLIGMIEKTDAPLVCCGEEMEELVPNTVDASREKHLPVVFASGDIVTVKIGSEAHPMLPEHYIQFVYLQTEKGGQRKRLSPGEIPEVSFSLINDKLIAVYSYCNIHGLWKVEI